MFWVGWLLTHWEPFYTFRSPHVDQVLCESDRLGVPRHGDGAVHAHTHAAQPAAAAPAARRGRVAVLAVGDADHGAAQLAAGGTREAEAQFSATLYAAAQQEHHWSQQPARRMER